MIPVGIVHTIAAAGGQQALHSMNRWRIEKAINRLEGKVQVKSRPWSETWKSSLFTIPKELLTSDFVPKRFAIGD
jgi:hypothetical protein